MQASTAQFAATIAGASMTVSYDVEILLPLADPYGPNYSLAVESIEIDRNLTTDLPDGTRLLEGYSAAQATITLSGYVSQTDASKTIAWLLNPAESTSPFYRHDILNSEVDVTAGLYLPGQSFPTVYRVFSGLIDDYSVDPQAGTVTLTCLDFHNSVIGPVTLPSLFNSGAYTVGAPAGVPRRRAAGLVLAGGRHRRVRAGLRRRRGPHQQHEQRRLHRRPTRPGPRERADLLPAEPDPA